MFQNYLINIYHNRYFSFDFTAIHKFTNKAYVGSIVRKVENAMADKTLVYLHLHFYFLFFRQVTFRFYSFIQSYVISKILNK